MVKKNGLNPYEQIRMDGLGVPFIFGNTHLQSDILKVKKRTTPNDPTIKG